MVRIDTNCPRITLDDVAGREYLKDIIRGAVYNKDSYEAIGMNKTGAYMFVGPEGSGKTYLSQAMAGEFRERKYAYLCCSIDKEGAFPEQLREHVLKELRTSNTFLAIRNIERLEDSYELGEMLREAEKSKMALVVAAAAKSVSDVDLDVGRMFTYIYTDLPNLGQRKAYFQKTMHGESRAAREMLAEETDGCGYSQLASVVAAIKLTLKEEYEKGVINADNSRREFEKAVDRLLREYKLRRIVYQPAAVSNAAAAPTAVKQEETKPAESDDYWSETVKGKNFEETSAVLREEERKQLEELEKTIAELGYATDIEDFPD